MRGAGCEAVVLHRECPATKQMQRDRLACKVKNVCISIQIYHDKYFLQEHAYQKHYSDFNSCYAIILMHTYFMNDQDKYLSFHISNTSSAQI